ncbi:hypothetical protein ACVNIS_11375 [Sphaerotilaceae bacterium SBD11-9]
MNGKPSNQFLDYATLGMQFLRAAENSCAELVKRDNCLAVVFNSEQGFDMEAYEEATGWSDHKIGVPILFTFFHGVELTLKAFLVPAGVGKKNHRLTQLLAEFESIYPNTKLAAHLRQCITGIDAAAPLGAFLDRNAATVDSWYQTLKYPETMNGLPVIHTALKYKGTDGVPFWESVGDAARDIRLECIALARSVGLAK